MRAVIIVKGNPIAYNPICMFNGFEAVSVNALFFHCSDNTFDHSILLRVMRSYELLFETITSNHGCEVPAGKNQSIVRAELEFPIDTTKCSKSTDQSML